MYKVLLIDDEPLARQLLESLLAEYSNVEVAATCGDGFEGFKAIQELHPDLVFLDVQMPRLNGFEMLELIDQPPAVIFTTAFDEFALKAFDAHAVDYLLKPIVKSRFDQAMKKWLAQAPGSARAVTTALATENIYGGFQQRIVVKDNGLIRIIPAKDILLLEANDDYVKIVTDDGGFLKKTTLAQLEQSLDPQQFVRVHRSYLIPVNQLLRIEPYEKDSHIGLLHCGAKVLVSKTGLARLKTVLGW